MTTFTKPVDMIRRLIAERSGHADSVILDEIRGLEALPDEQDPSWDDENVWSRANLLLALADVVATRRLDEGVGLVLDKMCLGDPGEMMRGMRHSMEAAVSRNWARLTEICMLRCSSERAGTRYWAVDELGVLRQPMALSTILGMFDDEEPEVAIAAFRAAAVIVDYDPSLRPPVITALRATSRKRTVLRDEAEDAIHAIQCAAPALGQIDHPELETNLARAIRAYRDGSGSDGAISSAFEWLLLWSLGQCDEWDGSGEPDGLVGFRAAITANTTLELRGQMTSFKGRGHCLEPFEARITIDDAQDTIRSGEIKYGDATVGLGAIPLSEGATRPEIVTSWLYVFVK